MIASIVQAGHVTITDLILFAGLTFGGYAAWRSKRGEFYKSVATEKKEENEQLRKENTTLRNSRDLKPILDKLDQFGDHLERHMETTERVFDKVADMNGALRHHATAMQALADRLILDEAARGLLAAAAERKPTREK